MVKAKSMQHWNGHQLCVIDTETTGLDPSFHEIVQIAVAPLNANIEIREGIPSFYINMKPNYPERVSEEALKVNGLTLAHIAQTGFDKETAKDLLIEWIQTLDLPYTKYGNQKKIMPLGQNYPFDMAFIKAWLGVELYNELFDYHHRDTMSAALYLNDKAACHANKVPYSKVNLTWLAHQLKVSHTRSHDALQDCMVTAEVYRQLCYQGLLG